MACPYFFRCRKRIYCKNNLVLILELYSYPLQVITYRQQGVGIFADFIQTGQLMADRGAGLLGIARNIHSSLTNTFNNLGHFICGSTLLVGHIAETAYHIFNGTNIIYHLTHSRGRICCHGFYTGQPLRAFTHTLCDIGGSTGNFPNNFLNFLGGFFTFSRQLPYFLRYYSKALAMLTGTGSLNSRIQRQQIGLTGNTTNLFYEILNLFRSYIKLINIGHRRLHYLTDIVDGLAHLIYGNTVFFCQGRRFLALFQAGGSRLRHIMCGTGNFHYTGRSLLQTAGISLTLGADG